MLQNDMKKISNQKGFTLIELLVVISVIGLLSSVILASLGEAREKAKWSAFSAEMVQIRNAVQLYREDNNGSWPPSVTSYGGTLELMLNELNSANLYSKTSLRDPDNGQYYVFQGYRIDSNDYASCGGFHQDVYFIIYVCGINGDTSESELFTELYYFYLGTPYPGGFGCTCMEIR